MKNVILKLTIILTVSCGEPSSNCESEKVTYDNEIQAIIQTACTNGDCHVGIDGGWQVLPDFSTYDNTLPFLESGSFNLRINSMDSLLSMPPNFIEERTISDTDLALLNDWLCHGFPEN